MIVPIICNSAQCGIIWFADNIFGGPGTIVTENCIAGPCPQCAGFGTIPDGQYNQAFGLIHRISDWQRVAFALMAIRDAIADGNSLSDIKKKISDNPDVASALKGSIPKDQSDLNKLLINLGIIIAALGYVFNSLPPVSVCVPQSIRDILSQIASEPRKETHTEQASGTQNKTDMPLSPDSEPDTTPSDNSN